MMSHFIKIMFKHNLAVPEIIPGNHYENTPIQHTAIFHGCKNDNFQMKFFDFLYIFAQNIDCGYTLELPH